MLQEILYAGNIVLIAETEAELRKKSYSRKSALESKVLKVNQVKSKGMVSKIGQAIIEPSNKKDPCGSCGRKRMLNTELF